MAGRRMPYAERHAQLLETAAEIVRVEGVDALTLARVAEEAGVSKPVAYEHFETRAGLLTVLYQRIDDQQVEAARAALAWATTPLDAVRLAAEAYVDCTLSTGREFGALTAALETIAGADDMVRAARTRYAQVLREAVEHFHVLPAHADVLMLGVIGATEALAREVAAERLDRTGAVQAITHITARTLSS